MKVKTVMLMILGFMFICSVAGANAPVTSGLVAEYDFQEGANLTILYDISGNDKNGTIYGTPAWTETGMYFDGVDDWVDLGDIGDFASGCTVFVAVENNVTGSRQAILARVNTTSAISTGKGYILEKSSLNNEYSTLLYHAVEPAYITQSKVIGDDNRWQVITSRYDADKLEVMTTTGVRCSNIDYGTSTLPSGMIDHTGRYTIGRQPYTSTHRYNGSIGYMAIYNRTLSDSEMLDMQIYVNSVMTSRSVVMPKTISTPYIILTLDDGYLSDYDNATRIASAKDVPLTSYIITDIVGDENRVTWSHINEMRNIGMGAESHTDTHIHLSATDNASIITSLANVNNAFISNGLPQPEHISYPFGDDDARSREIVSQVYASGRDVNSVYARNIISCDSLDFYGYQMRSYEIYGTDADAIKQLIDNAIASNTSLFLYTHDVNDDPSAVGCNNEAFEQVINYIALKRDAGLIIPVTHDGFYRAFQGIRTIGYTGNMFTGQTTEITDDKTVDQVGFVWGTVRKNNPGNVAPSATAYSHYWTTTGDYENTEFTHAVSFSGTVYYRAAAKVNGTWVYGEELTVDSTLKMPYVSNGISYRVDANGYVYNYSKKLTTETKAPLIVMPSAGTVNVTVDAWSINNKVWKESSESHDITTTHIIGGLPAGYDINILCDGALYRTERVNSTGYITWTYSGGFSEHTFEAVISGYPVTADIQDSFVSSWGNTVSMVGAIIVIALAGSMIMMFRGKKDLSEVMNDLPGILLIVVLLVTGAIIFGQF